MIGRNIFKKGIGNDKIIGGIILMLFGIGGIFYGLSIYSNQNASHTCITIIGTPGQPSLNNGLACMNKPGLLILSIVPSIFGIALLIAGSILLTKGVKNKKYSKTI
jgi:hypothetical protein